MYRLQNGSPLKYLQSGNINKESGARWLQFISYVAAATNHRVGVELSVLCCFWPGIAEDGPRVVFMVDLWHPNVAAAERQALDYIFTPGRWDGVQGRDCCWWRESGPAGASPPLPPPARSDPLCTMCSCPQIFFKGVPAKYWASSIDVYVAWLFNFYQMASWRCDTTIFLLATFSCNCEHYPIDISWCVNGLLVRVCVCVYIAQRLQWTRFVGVDCEHDSFTLQIGLSGGDVHSTRFKCYRFTSVLPSEKE